ncbi:endoplasmic reticulum resident protein 44-like protein [Dinothrombium tinctorium]|uniref:Endoplasmic reticulum resident protein 44-like protein n=1 Tax=Dinothrombium tinctorium TaxID=1965070 RepID=A0A3S3QJD9_9ACAR|nr:endoplasmic reticulum resident protein 44-like protein [Dinothrombium tinctorium]RWS09687.1 endoplasmic reticulum resident protein 44-like protein [Dinothrombium tinctorium]
MSSFLTFYGHKVTSICILINVILTCLNSVIFANISVVQLTNSNFDHFVSKYELVFINFYADWCRFSQILAPIFEESFQKIQNEIPDANRVLLAKVDCDAESELSQRFHISKYPTLKLVRNSQVAKKEFRGQRSAQAIFDFVKEQLSDPVEKLKTIDKLDAIDEKKTAIIGYFDLSPESAVEYTLFRRVATDLKDDCKFYWLYEEASKSHPHSGKSNFVVHKPARSRPGEKDEIFPSFLANYNELSKWASNKCISLVREITFENAEELTEEGLPFLILFHHPDDTASVDLYTKTVHEQLQNEAHSVNFLIADGIKFAHPLHHLGKDKKDLPLIAIDSFRHMYLFPNFEDIKIPGKLRQFVSDLHSGKLHREFHFGPDPTTQQQQDDSGVKATSPPESTFKKLAPSSNRYTLLRDEL